jgi:hypothetical protein
MVIDKTPSPQLVNTFRLAVFLKISGTLFVMFVGFLISRNWLIQRWWVGLVTGIGLLLLLFPWQHLAQNRWRGWSQPITHRQLILVLALAIIAPQIELIHASALLPSHDPTVLQTLGWTQEQVNSIYTLGGLFMMAPVVLASWQYGWRGFILTLIWSGVWYVLTPLALPRDAFTWALYAIRLCNWV